MDRLVFMGLWMLQAATGVLLVFHWELDDATVPGPARALDVNRFGAGLERLAAARPDRAVTAVYPSGGLPGRFDVLLAASNGQTDAVRVDGAGTVLRERPWDHDFGRIGPFQIATYLHQTLFAHQLGTWFIGLSGALLISNIAIGAVMAWPRPGRWRAALTPAKAASPPAEAFAWHRAAGLWLVAPALLLVCCGVVMAFETPLAGWFDDARPRPSATAAAREPLVAGRAGAAQAMVTAFHSYPGARLAALEAPSPQTPWWLVRLRQGGEFRRVAGLTTVLVSSASGRVLASYDALKAPAKARLWEALYAVHTGEIAGAAGRWAALAIGLWLVTMIGLGLRLWAVRRAIPSTFRGRRRWRTPHPTGRAAAFQEDQR